MRSETPPPHRVLIAGGGVAGLEALLALRELAVECVSLTLLTPEREFTYRPRATWVRMTTAFASSSSAHCSPWVLA
jgi:NADH dehydrogenase FAD-containing subunit